MCVCVRVCVFGELKDFFFSYCFRNCVWLIPLPPFRLMKFVRIDIFFIEPFHSCGSQSEG